MVLPILQWKVPGFYWKPVFNVLGDDFQILLVNARHIKNVPGHKTDKKDSRWLAKLLLSGLLKGVLFLTGHRESCGI
jgi:hypothetical protein